MKKQLLLVALLSAGFMNVKAGVSNELNNLVEMYADLMASLVKDKLYRTTAIGAHNELQSNMELALSKSKITLKDVRKKYNELHEERTLFFNKSHRFYQHYDKSAHKK